MKWSKTETEWLISQCKNTKKSRLAIISDYYKKFGDNGRTTDAIQRKITGLKQQGIVSYAKILEDNLRIGYADIEATNLNADFGFMLSYCIKPAGSRANDMYGARITPEEIWNRKFDKRILEQYLKDIKNFDVLYYHYGIDGKFDSPFIRARIFANNLEYLLDDNAHELRLRDTWKIARYKLNISRNSLDNIARHLKITSVKKTPLTGNDWIKAAYGDKKALDYVWKHNRHDVLVLEKIHKKLRLIEKPKDIF